jgi:hypothetical protein
MEPSLKQETAIIEIQPESEYMTAQVVAHVENATDQEIEFILAVQVPDSPGKLVIQEITQAGRPCRFKLAQDRVFVAPAEPGDEIEIKFVYSGKPRQDPDDFIRRDEIVLRMDGAWLPIPPSSCADFDITIRHPSNYTFFGQGNWEGQKRIDGERTESRWTLGLSNGYTLYGAPKYTIKKTKAVNTEIITAVWPGDSHLLDELSKIITDVMLKLTEAIGEYPYPVLRIVESGRWDGRSGYGAISNVSIGYQKLREGIDKIMIAHELTHGWWGGIVPPSQESLHKGQWNETLAEYTSIWVLDSEEAWKLRRKWSMGYASLEDEKDRPILEIGSYSAPHWSVNEAINYFKGALMMVAFEDLVGLDTVKKTLDVFIERRREKPSSWEDILKVVKDFCGVNPASWLEEWLSYASAPRLKLVDIHSEGSNLEGVLVQTSTPLYKGHVDLGCFVNRKLLSIKRIFFQKEKTHFQFKIPEETGKVILDYDYRLPRRYEPEKEPVEVRLN